MSANITVRFYGPERTDSLQAYALRVVAESATDMDKEVFVFQRGAAVPPGSKETLKDQFICIADPVDLEEIPIGSPNLEAEIPYYRKAEVTLMFRSMIELEETRTDIKLDLAHLVTSLVTLEELTVMEEITYD